VERASDISPKNAQDAKKTRKLAGAEYENVAWRIIIPIAQLAENSKMSMSAKISTIFSPNFSVSFSDQTEKLVFAE